MRPKSMSEEKTTLCFLSDKKYSQEILETQTPNQQYKQPSHTNSFWVSSLSSQTFLGEILLAPHHPRRGDREKQKMNSHQSQKQILQKQVYPILLVVILRVFTRT